jgi:hypothetical protein
MTCAALGEIPCHDDSNAAYESRKRILGEASCTMLCHQTHHLNHEFMFLNYIPNQSIFI